ncbi:MAG: tRNA (adenosine(37)-N6)-threonylcarbamoyltransferase complex ATPase subunit type 1 TsaE [Omnitrophica WOR_2 bacterium RBG_13_44_8b]|nr:MAG: tRNA (adenosine(37)-N6)-threonylcarbamoyltransferase complex ATPase subunit type 1 TsaE [Omnitrophica WOR_2 bacterium RBG_13_44_8b]
MRLISNSVQDTLNIGKAMAEILQKGDIVCLFGELGSGKTVLTKGIALGLGVKKTPINSPSFVLIRQYAGGKIPLYHFDLYRLKALKDIMSLGCEEYFYDEGITVIEWADRLNYLLPEEFIKIELSFRTGSKRQLRFSAFGGRYKKILKRIHANIRH